MHPLLKALNPRQQEVVVHPAGPLLVLAGAGSGKTRVLTHRVAYLVEESRVAPYRILAFTFTNKAAREMKERIAALVGEQSGLWVGTFHSICVRILRRQAEHLGRTGQFTIYDADDQRAVFKRCIKDAGYSDKELRPQVVQSVVSNAKNRLVGPATLEAEAVNDARPEFMQRVAQVYRSYERRLQEANAFDFDDLIVRTLEVLRSHPEVKDHYAGRFLHVTVDEYQDTNHAQYALITELAAAHKNLMVVGDDDQSIYSWRGADIQNILSFEATYPDATVVRLEQNYRSTKRILRAANHVVRHNQGRKPKELWTDNDEGEPLVFCLLADEEAEAEALVTHFREAIETGEMGYGDCVVLYRTHATSRAIEGALRRHGIRYEIIGGVSFFERREVKDILAYLRLAQSPVDDVSFLRVVNVPKRGIGQTTVERLRRLALKLEVSLFEAVGRLDAAEDIAPAACRRLGAFRGIIEGFRAHLDWEVTSQMGAILEETGYLAYLEADDPLTADGRRENLEELAAAAAHFAESSGDSSLAGFLADVALVADVDQLEDGTEAVTLMTAHNAKGLEFDWVAVAGLEQGLFPHVSSFEDAEEMEEERRLFYVALTRARKRVLLTAARRRWRYGSTTESPVSDFIAELPAEDLVVVDLGGHERGGRQSYGERAARQAPGKRPSIRRLPVGAPESAPEPWAADTDGDHVQVDPEEGWRNRVGEPVMHAQFGRGTVIGQEGFGPDARLVVRFDGAVTKKVVARYVSELE